MTLDPHSDAARLLAETHERVVLLVQDGVRSIATRLDEGQTPPLCVIEGDDIAPTTTRASARGVGGGRRRLERHRRR